MESVHIHILALKIFSFVNLDATFYLFTIHMIIIISSHRVFSKKIFSRIIISNYDLATFGNAFGILEACSKINGFDVRINIF